MGEGGTIMKLFTTPHHYHQVVRTSTNFQHTKSNTILSKQITLCEQRTQIRQDGCSFSPQEGIYPRVWPHP